jgi:hypothetical protein
MIGHDWNSFLLNSRFGRERGAMPDAYGASPFSSIVFSQAVVPVGSVFLLLQLPLVQLAA